MAEIVPMPVRINPAGAPELIAILTKAITSGADLGPRGLQIRSVSYSLQHLLDALRITIEEIMAKLPPDDAATQKAKVALENVCSKLDALIEQARTFPIGIQPQTITPIASLLES